MQDVVGAKWCNACKQLLSVAEFNYKHRDRGVFQHRCKRCQSRYAREHYQRNTASYLKRIAKNNQRIREKNRQRLHNYLSTERCLDCGIQDLAVLEFDHRDPLLKEYDVSALVGAAFSWSTVLREIAKCDVVCANCHRKRTARQFGWHKVAEPRPTLLPHLPKRGTADYERIKSRRSGLARRHRNRLLAWQYLADHPCIVCGVGDPVVLDFDHLGDKSRDVGWLIAAGCRATILNEISKCRVLCANCHRKHTAWQAGRPR
jgi:hypothetical protein